VHLLVGEPEMGVLADAMEIVQLVYFAAAGAEADTGNHQLS